MQQPIKTASAPPVFKFLSKAEKIFFTGSLVTITNGKKYTQYNFEADFDDSIVYLSQVDLAKLKYDLQVVNECMVIIKGPDFDGYALCRQKQEKQGWIEGMVTESASSI